MKAKKQLYLKNHITHKDGNTVRLYADLTKVLAKSVFHDKLPKWVQAHLLLSKSQKVNCHLVFRCSKGCMVR